MRAAPALASSAGSKATGSRATGSGAIASAAAAASLGVSVTWSTTASRPASRASGSISSRSSSAATPSAPSASAGTTPNSAARSSVSATGQGWGSTASSSRIRSDVGQAIGDSITGVWPLAGSSAWPLPPCGVNAPPASRSGKGAARTSWPRFGAQLRQRPSASFQQLPQVYCRQDMQKLNVLWNASSWWVVTSRSVSLRAAAIASSIDVSSDMTKFLSPRDTTLRPLRRGPRGAADSNV